MTENLIDIRNLIVRYKTDTETVFAVNNLSLSLKVGESLGLVGETGAGKTTTALSILNLIPHPPGEIVSGEIYFQGQDLLKISKHRMRNFRGNKISMIFQDPMTSLNPVHSVGEQIAEVVRLHERCSKAQATQKAAQMLELVGIPSERYHEYPHEFSGGMKQRVVIAMSIACSPQLILADEPTTALDVTIQAQVLELMNDLKEKIQTSMLLITHDLGVVAQVCERVAIMYSGEIVESGSIDEVFSHPAHPYTIGLFGSIPTIETGSNQLIPIKGLVADPTDLPKGCYFEPRCPYSEPLCKEIHPELIPMDGTQSCRCLAVNGQIKRPDLEEVIRIGRE